MNVEKNSDKPETNPNPFSKINTFYLGGFKAFKEIQEIPIRPITLIFGPNSSGKSSIIHGLKLVKSIYYIDFNQKIKNENILNANSNRLEIGIKLDENASVSIENAPIEITLAELFEFAKINLNKKVDPTKPLQCSLIKYIFEKKNNNEYSRTVELKNSDLELVIVDRKILKINSIVLDRLLSKAQNEIFKYASEFNKFKKYRNFSDILNLPEADALITCVREVIYSASVEINGLGRIVVNKLNSTTAIGNMLLAQEKLKSNLFVSPFESFEYLKIYEQFKEYRNNRIQNATINEFSYYEDEDEDEYENGSNTNDIFILYKPNIEFEIVEIQNNKKYVEFDIGNISKIVHLTALAVIDDFSNECSNIIMKLKNKDIDLTHLDAKRVSLKGDGKFEQYVHNNQFYITSMNEIPKINLWFRNRGISATLMHKNDDNILPNQIDKDGIWVRDSRVKNMILGFDDIGFGFQKLIPVVALAQSNNEDAKLIAIEEPEMHLHPKLQSDIGDLFVDNVINNSQKIFIIETHSENLLQRILRRIREGVISHEAVCVLYVHPSIGDEGARVDRLEINAEGEFIKPWPKGFFDSRIDDIVAGYED